MIHQHTQRASSTARIYTTIFLRRSPHSFGSHAQAGQIDGRRRTPRDAVLWRGIMGRMDVSNPDLLAPDLLITPSNRSIPLRSRLVLTAHRADIAVYKNMQESFSYIMAYHPVFETPAELASFT